MFKIFVSGHTKNRAMWVFSLSLDNNWLKILNCHLGPTPLPLSPPKWSIFSLASLTIAFTMLCVNLKGTCSGQSKVSPYNKLQHAYSKRDVAETSSSPTFQPIRPPNKGLPFNHRTCRKKPQGNSQVSWLVTFKALCLS